MTARATPSDERVAAHSDEKTESYLRRTLIWSWPITLAVFVAIFWITIKGGEIGGAWLERGFSWLIGAARAWLTSVQAPWWVTGALVDGFIVGEGTVITVMLPPMLILFTAFALMEDLGLLPWLP